MAQTIVCLKAQDLQLKLRNKTLVVMQNRSLRTTTSDCSFSKEFIKKGMMGMQLAYNVKLYVQSFASVSQ